MVFDCSWKRRLISVSLYLCFPGKKKRERENRNVVSGVIVTNFGGFFFFVMLSVNAKSLISPFLRTDGLILFVEKTTINFFSRLSLTISANITALKKDAVFFLGAGIFCKKKILPQIARTFFSSRYQPGLYKLKTGK